MKKITTTLCVLSIVYGYSQNIVLLNDNKSIISNTIIDLSIDTSSSVTKEILIKNAGSIPDTLKVVRTVFSKDSADQTQFCWGGLCYGFSINTSSQFLIIAPGDTVNFGHNGFHASFNSGHASVTRLVHYKFYNVHHSTDSTGVTLRYLSSTGIDELSKVGEEIDNAYPNPTNSSVSIKYSINESRSKCRIIFYDMLGKSVKENILNAKQGIVKINVADLKAGIYFYSLMIDEKAISTKKIVIN